MIDFTKKAGLVTTGLVVGTLMLAGADDSARTLRPVAAGNQAERADRGWVGLMFDEKADGARVARVFPGGPAAFAGVRAGDVVLGIDDTGVGSPAAVAKAVEALTPGEPAVMTVQRGKQSLKLDVKIGSLARFHEGYTREMLRRDPRDPRFAENHGISDADRTVELVRRLFEQNERLERSLDELRQEVRELRTELKSKAN